MYRNSPYTIPDAQLDAMKHRLDSSISRARRNRRIMIETASFCILAMAVFIPRLWTRQETVDESYMIQIAQEYESDIFLQICDISD